MQSSLAKHFDEVAHIMKEQKSLKSNPSTEQLKKVYGLFKQATVGNVNTERPGMFDLTGKAKWDSWASFKDISQEDAKHQYVEFCRVFIKDDVAAKFN